MTCRLLVWDCFTICWHVNELLLWCCYSHKYEGYWNIQMKYFNNAYVEINTHSKILNYVCFFQYMHYAAYCRKKKKRKKHAFCIKAPTGIKWRDSPLAVVSHVLYRRLDCCLPTQSLWKGLLLCYQVDLLPLLFPLPYSVFCTSGKRICSIHTVLSMQPLWKGGSAPATLALLFKSLSQKWTV